MEGGLPVSAETRINLRGAPRIELTKNADVRTAKPGEEIHYEIGVRATAAYSGIITVRDPLPAELTYIEGISRPAALYDSLAHSLTWTLSGAAGDSTRKLTFTLTPGRDLAPGEVQTRNIATATMDSVTFTSNSADVAVSAPFFTIQKTANPTVAETGDFVVYRLVVRNLSKNDSLSAITIRDLIPYGFAFVKDSARLDGTPLPPDSLRGREIGWRISGLGAGKTRQLNYRLLLGTGAASGDGVNTATATASTPSGTILSAEPAKAKVQIRPDLFSLDEVILGRAWVDLNENGVQDENEPPVPGIILVMEDGTRIIADRLGRFSIPEARPGDHVLRLMEQNIPEDLEPASLGVRSADDPWIRFVSISTSGMAKANFPFHLKKVIEEKVEQAPQIFEIIVPEPKIANVWIERAIGPDSIIIATKPLKKLILDSVSFDTGKDMLKPEARTKLAEFITIIQKAAGQNIKVSGHTDSSPIHTREFPDNMVLSLARAKAVKSFMTSSGLDPADIETYGFGPDHPLATNKTPEGRQQNRRVEITFESAASADTVSRRSRIVLTLGAKGISSDERFKVFQNLPSGYSLPSGDSTGTAELKPGESFTLEITKAKGASVELTAPSVTNPVYGAIHLNYGGKNIDSGIHERWTADIQITAPRDSIIPSTRTGRAAQDSVIIPYQDTKDTGKLLQRMKPLAGDSTYVSRPDTAKRSLPERESAKLTIAPKARIAGPGQVVWIEYPSDGMVSFRDRLTVIARGNPGSSMILTVNGKEVASIKVRPDSKADFLNIPSPPGPITLRISQAQPDGQVLTDSVSVHVIGPAAKVTVEVEPSTLPADSLSMAEVGIRVFDAWGMPLPDGQIVTLQLDNGAILSKDMYPEEPGVQMQVRGGVASAQVQAPGKVGEGRLNVVAEGVNAQAVLNYTTPFEKGILVGMASGQIGWKTNRSAPAGVITGDDFKEGTYSNGKVAFFARGTMGKGYLLTTSYDTDRKYNDRMFRYLTPERAFPIYGDASSIFYEAPSASKLFVRMEKDRSYFQYGNFVTNFAQVELTAYNRTFTGLSTAGRNNRTSWNMFGAFTEQSIQVDELPGEGVSGHYYLTASQRGVPVVEGSERIAIQTRDRLHPENIIREEVQYRFTDYEIDYEAGTILFKRPVPYRSPDENPIIIVATYETARALERHLVGGGRFALHSGDAWEVGASLAGEERSNSNYWLTGLDAKVQTVGDILLNTEIARSSQAQEGWAWKVGAQGKIRSIFDYELYYRTADRSFYNPSSTTAFPGVRKLRGRFSFRPLSAATITGEAYQADDSINDEGRTSLALGGTYRWKTLRSIASMEMTTTDHKGVENNGSILNTGLEWAVTRRLTLKAERDQNFKYEDLNYRPTLNRLHARWALTDRMDIVMEHAFRDYRVMDSSFTAIGIQSPISENLTAYANYKLDGGINGQKNEAIMGLRHRFRPLPYYTFNTAFERMRTLRGNRQGDFFSYSLAGEYLPPQSVKASARYEKRDGKTLDKTVATGAVDFVLAKDLSLLAKHTYLDEGHAANNPLNYIRSHHFLSGLSWRSSASDQLNILGKYEYKSQYNSIASPITDRMTHIGSLEMIMEPRSQFEWFIRYAFKVSQLSSERVTSQTLTDLWMTNLRFEWNREWDILGEYRILSQHTVHDLNQGAAFEIGRIIQRSSRLAIGYNFTGYHDSDFACNSYWGQGPYIKIQVKFNESDVASTLNGLQSFIQR